jgi:hypothetical protein
MPTASLSTFATGARQLVVHEPLETTFVILGQLVVIDAEDDGEVGAVGGSRNQHALGACCQMRRGLVLRREQTGALERDIDAHVLPRQFRKGRARR